MATDVLLNVRGLHAGYGETEILRGIDLAVGAGDIVAVLGSNGAGKSTLNLAISGLVAAREGSIEFDGRFIHDASPAAIVAAGLVHVPEGRRIFPNMSVADNLDLGSYRRASAQRAINRERVFAMFPRLRERASQRAGTLSGGEQQMLAIGRGLMAEPKLLILDEPSLGLSPLLVEEMFAMILRLNKDGLAVLLVEQNVVQSLDIVHRAYILEHGSFVMSGSAADIRSDANLKRAFLGL
ncbi:MAG TPA: ABC transporter ATP-binding protein [Pseudolabrys sp.]|jgi:branched-chain amino acid transport system ATP-binding protein